MRVRNPDSRDALADEFLRSTGVDIREGHGEAFYVPSRDFISMPAFEAFKGADHFYNVAFHELTHWTGHKSRLDRDLKDRFGERTYAAEELVAELGAAFLAAEFSFDGDVRNAGYSSPRATGPPRPLTICAAWRSLSLRRSQHEAMARADAMARFVQLSSQSTAKGGVRGAGSDFRPKTTHSL
jgi:hypothetical protein